MTSSNFKARLGVHTQSFNHRDTNQTSLSRYIWELKDKNEEFKIKYKIVDRGYPYNPKTEKCLLCLKEKTFIITRPNESSLNRINEFINKCLHREKYLLGKVT